MAGRRSSRRSGPALILPILIILCGSALPTLAARATSLPLGTARLTAGHLLFVQNVGQFDRAARFQCRAAGATAWLTPDALWLTYLERGRRGVHLKLTFPGMNPRVRLVPSDPQPTRMNYFLGSDPTRWRHDVPTFGAVRWKDLYPGISLDLREVNGELALVVVAGPGSDLNSVGLRVQGAVSLRHAPDGRLVAQTGLGPLRLPPVLYGGRVMSGQIDGGDVSFSALGGTAVAPASTAFSAGSGLRYGTFLGGSEDDDGSDVAVGPDGSIYVTGQTLSPDFPTTPGAFDRRYNSGRFGGDAFVSRLDPSGSTLLYSTFLGGSDTEYGLALAVGPEGAAYLAGYTYARDFPTTPGSFSPTWNGGCCDAFVTKLNAYGTALVYSTFVGGGSFDDISAIALGPDQVVHATGETLSPDFPTTDGARDRIINRDGKGLYSDAFVTALNPDGSDLVRSTFLGGRYNDFGLAITLNDRGSEYVTGNSQSPDFPTTRRAFDRTFNGGTGEGDVFVTKMTPTGTALSFSTYVGGSDDEGGSAIALGTTGGVFVVGATSSADFPVTRGAFDTSINSFIFSDAFAARLSPRGRWLRYGTFLGGSDSDFGADLTLNPDGTLSLTGTTFSNNFPTTAGALERARGGPADAFVTRFDVTGRSLGYSTYLGGTGRVVDVGTAIAWAEHKSVYVTGKTFSDDFPTTPGAHDRTYNGRFDAYVAAVDLT
jgi:hypothetical protein